jgi:hypothetical protein
VPHVRLSVRGPNKTGEAHFCFLLINQLKAIETQDAQGASIGPQNTRPHHKSHEVYSLAPLGHSVRGFGRFAEGAVTRTDAG